LTYEDSRLARVVVWRAECFVRPLGTWNRH